MRLLVIFLWAIMCSVLGFLYFLYAGLVSPSPVRGDFAFLISVWSFVGFVIGSVVIYVVSPKSNAANALTVEHKKAFMWILLLLGVIAFPFLYSYLTTY